MTPETVVVALATARPVVGSAIGGRYGLAGLSLPAMSALTGATAGLMICIAAVQWVPAARETRCGRRALLHLLEGILAVIVMDLVI